MTAHVLVLLENQPFPYDPRVRPMVDALLTAGYFVTVASPMGYGFDAASEEWRGAKVVRYRPPAAGRGLLGYVREYGLSLLRLGRLVWQVEWDRRVDVVLVCSPPDFLILLALPLARRGAAVVFDDRELSPELFEAKFGRQGLAHRALLWAEGFAFRHSDAVIITNSSYADNVRRRGGVDDARIFVVGNGPDPRRIFPVQPRPELRSGRKHLVLWMGSMSRQEGLERLIEAADELVNRRGRDDVTFAMVGPGDIHDQLRADVRRRGLEEVMTLPGRADDDLVRAYMSTADVCVGVDERNRMNDRAAMRKVLEYMAMGRSVVQFPLTHMRTICGNATAYSRNADAHDLAERIEELLDDPARRRELGATARRQVIDQRLLWPDQVPSLLAAISTALMRRAATSRMSV